MSRAPFAPMGFFVTWHTIICPGFSICSIRSALELRVSMSSTVVADVTAVEHGILRGGDVDEGCLHARKHVLDPSEVDVAVDLTRVVRGARDEVLDQGPTLEHRDLGGVRPYVDAHQVAADRLAPPLAPTSPSFPGGRRAKCGLPGSVLEVVVRRRPVEIGGPCRCLRPGSLRLCCFWGRPASLDSADAGPGRAGRLLAGVRSPTPSPKGAVPQPAAVRVQAEPVGRGSGTRVSDSGTDGDLRAVSAEGAARLSARDAAMSLCACVAGCRSSFTSEAVLSGASSGEALP